MLSETLHPSSKPGPGRPRAGALLPALLLLGVVTVPLGAQERPELPAPDSVLEVEELVVTAHRLPVPADELTLSATVIDRAEIERSGAEQVSELLRSVAGVHVARNGSWGGATSLFVRGGESNYVQVLVDGVPVNRPGGDFDFSTLSTDNVERIEVVRGPASVVYGSDAVSGVVQVFTREGDGPLRASASATGGTHGTLDWDASVTGGGDDVSYAFALSRFVTDGILDFNNEFENTVGSGRVVVRPGERTEASLSIRYTDHAAHTPTDASGAVVDENQFGFGDELVVGARLRQALTDRLDARVELRLDEVDTGFDDAPDGPADTLGAFAFQSDGDLSRRSLDARLDWELGEGTVLTAGIERERQEERSSNESRSAFGTSAGSLDVDRSNTGLYLQALGRPVEGLTLSAGARLDDNEAFGMHDTYRLGAAWELPTATRIRGSFGTAFKEPTFFENFASGFVTGNPDLEPETTESWELGAEQEWVDAGVSLSVTWFDQHFRDLIQFTSSPPEPGAPNYFNVAAADASGLEVGSTVALPGGAGLDLSYTWLETGVEDAGFDQGPDAAFVEGDRLLRRPTHSARAGLHGPLPRRGTFRVDASWIGKRDDRDFSTFPARRVVLDDYLRVDVGGRMPLLPSGDGRPGIEATLRVENVTDVTYQQVRGFRAPGRTILVGAEFTAGL